MTVTAPQFSSYDEALDAQPNADDKKVLKGEDKQMSFVLELGAMF